SGARAGWTCDPRGSTMAARTGDLRRSWLLATALVAVAAVGGVIAPHTSAQAGSCTAQAQASWDATDLESGDALIATHLINVRVTFSDGGLEDTVKISPPPGVAVIDPHSPEGRHLGIRKDQIVVVANATGALPMTVTWDEDEQTGTGAICSGRSEASFDVQAARPLRLHHFEHFELPWSLRSRLGAHTDRRPVTLRLRSVRGARLPGPTVPFKTATLDLRANPEFDPPLRNLRANSAARTV
ncbi:MAG TPA: hypothetical protein VK486_15045, partial [Thermoleophilaceae bacterium]|nr:hypothetical protein [Thermoleophilaceae bacterium]